MSGHGQDGGCQSSSVFVCSTAHGQSFTSGGGGGGFSSYGSSSSDDAPANSDHFYLYNGLPGPPPPSSLPPYPPFHLDGGQASPRNLYRNEQNFYSSHHPSNRNGALIAWPGREIPGLQSSSYPGMIYPPPSSPWQSSFDGGLDMRSVPMLRPPKPKRPRMSLQKRLLVNARERERMRVLNKAFESLRDALPCYIADGHMAKITTLRLAINYIKALTDLLNEQKVLGSKPGAGYRKEKSHEELFSNILKDSRVDGIKPVLKNLDERLAISKAQGNKQDLLDKFAFMQQHMQ